MGRDAGRRQASGRAVVLASGIVAGSFLFGRSHSDDRDPLQWPAAMSMMFAGFVAFVVTLIYFMAPRRA
jgi:hypothetical protein